MSDNKKVLVLWSGGLDSTYLIQYYLGHGYEVKAGYIKIGNNKGLINLEGKAIKNMLPVFNAYSKFKYVGCLGKAKIDYTKTSIILKQVPVFMMFAAYANRGMGRVAMGYVMNDDAISYLPEIKAIYNSYEGLSREHPMLELPLVKYQKVDIIGWLDKKLLKHITWCECPEKKKRSKLYIPCKECCSCKRQEYLIPKIEERLSNKPVKKRRK